jgi:NitT/TauT family transport system permease protein
MATEELSFQAGAGTSGPQEPSRTATLSGLDALELAGAKTTQPLAARIWRSAWPKLLAVAIVLLVWELVYLSGWRDPWVLPGPQETLAEWWRQLGTGEGWNNIARTLWRAGYGFAISLVVGGALGLAVARIPVLRAAIGSMITALQTLPSVAWVPIAILLFQLGETTILFVVVLGAAPSIANGVIAGVDFVPPLWLRAGRNIGAHGLALYRHVAGPASLPAIVAGLKQGWAFAWRSLMAAEIIGAASGGGVGLQMTVYRDMSQPPGLFATLITILIIGVLVDAVFSWAERTMRARRGLAEAA